MWPGPSASRFGATGSQDLADGNKIATFADPVDGAAAHFDLLSRSYAGMPLSAAISKWSGGNSSAGYADNVAKQAGIGLDTRLTPEMLAGPQGLALAKAQAQWEAGKPFPLSDDQWQQAQAKAFGGNPVATASPSAPVAPPAAPSSPPGSSGTASPPLGMLAGQMPDPNAAQQSDPAIALLQQHAQAMMQEQPDQSPPLPPIDMPLPRGQLAARLRAAALGRGLTGGI